MNTLYERYNLILKPRVWQTNTCPQQLTKSPEEYRTVKGNPHVLVAKDMRRSGIAVKTGDTIPYIYCTKVTTDGVVVREPRMPDDVYSGKAAIGRFLIDS